MDAKDLLEWYAGFVKHKDIFAKKIEKIEQGKDCMLVHYKDQCEEAYPVPALENGNIPELKKEKRVTIITANTKKNLDLLVANWQKLARYPELTIYFVNPASTKEIKWVIRPNLHDKVADTDTLKSGLKSLFLTVDPA